MKDTYSSVSDRIGDYKTCLLYTSFHDLLGGKANEIGNLYEHYGTLFEQAEHERYLEG